jgi:protein phosphatase-4 regulatory subunit 3
MLVFLVAQHTYRSKYFILGSNISLKVAVLLRIRDKWLRLGELILVFG